MMLRLAAALSAPLAGLALLAGLACSEGKKSAVHAPPPAPVAEPVLPEPAVWEAQPPTSPRAPEALAMGGEEVKTDAQQVAEFEKVVLK